jgi:DNA-binding NarL/FixJ family response regulator
MKILIADDHQLVREGLKLLIHQFGDAPEFLEAHDYVSLREQLRSHPEVDLVVVDLHMPGADHGLGLEAIAQAHPTTPLVVVSAFSSPDVVRKALAIATVYAFVPKNGSPACMHTAMQAALLHNKLGEVSDAYAVPVQSPDAMAPRFEAVRTLLREGKSNKAIAHELGLSEGTVKNYMSEIFKTLKVTNRTQAARFDEQAPF